MKEINKLASEHAWRYFELHAQQRINVFNFYIAITGLLAAGIGFSLQQGGKYYYLCTLLGIFMTFISIIFWKLDARVSTLIKKAEKALREIELEFESDNQKIFIIDYNEQDSKVGKSLNWSYGKCFRLSFFIVGNIGLILTLTPLISLLIK